MPLTAKGEKILAAMIEEYGEERGKKIFYASKNAGTISGVDTAENADDARKRRRTQARDPFGREAGTWEEETDAVNTMHDAIELEFDDGAEARIIDGGYMRAMPKIARTGIQIYKGKECGRPDVDKVYVYRPHDSVFAQDAVKSYTHLPVTIEHPGVPVDARNWRKYAVGETGDEVLRDGGTVRVPMMLRDAAAIQAMREGKNQISVGYSCDLDWGEGVDEDGQKYDAVQRNIRGNHVAIVSTARGGPELKFGDEGDHAMELKTVTIDGIACQMTDTAASLVQRMQDAFELFKKKKKGEEEEEEKTKKDSEAKDAVIKVKDAEIAELTKKLTDALDPKRTRDAAIKLLTVMDRAAKIMGKPVKIDNVTDDISICREVVSAKLGDIAKGWDDNKIEAAFDSIGVLATPSTSSPIKDAVRVFGAPPNGGHPSGSADPRDQAYYDSVKELENAWRPKQ